MSNTPFFIGIFFIVSAIGYLLGEQLYPRLHQCFFLGASCTSPYFCFSILR